MTTTLNAIAIDVVGQYSEAAHHCVEAWRSSAEQRLRGPAARAVARASVRADDAIDRVSGRAIQTMQAFGEEAAWANELLLVNALRSLNLPAARLSLRVASGVNKASSRLSQRIGGAGTAGGTAPARPAAKRTRRAAAKA